MIKIRTISVQDQGVALEWIDDYNPAPICHLPRRVVMSGFNLRVDVSARKRYCEANGKPFDAEVYNTQLANLNPEGEFDGDYDVYIGVNYPETCGQDNTNPLLQPPP